MASGAAPGGVDQEALAKAQAAAQAELAKLGGDEQQQSQLTPSQRTALNIGTGMTGSLGTEYLFPAGSQVLSKFTGNKPMTASDFDRESTMQPEGFQKTGEEALGMALPFVLGAGPYRRGLEAVEGMTAAPKMMKAAAAGSLSTRALPQLAHGTGLFALRDLILNKAPEQASGAENRSPGEIATQSGTTGAKESLANLLFGKVLHSVAEPAISKVSSLADAYLPDIRKRAMEIIGESRKAGVPISGDQAAAQAAREGGSTAEAGAADQVRQKVSNMARDAGKTGDIKTFETRQGGALDAAKMQADTEVERILKTKGGKTQSTKDLSGTTIAGADQDVAFQSAKLLNDVKATMPSGVTPGSPQHYVAAMEEAGRRVAMARNPAERAAAQANIDHLQKVLLQEAPRVAEAAQVGGRAATAEEAAVPYPKPEKAVKKPSSKLSDVLYATPMLGAAGNALMSGNMGHAALAAGAAAASPVIRAATRKGAELAGGWGRGGAVDTALNKGEDFVQNVGRIGTNTGAAARALGVPVAEATPPGLLSMVPDFIKENAIDPLSYIYQTLSGASDETPEEKLARRRKGRGQ